MIGKKARIHKAVIDRGVKAPDKMRVGVFHDEDAKRGFIISPGGYAIIPRNYVFE